VVVWSSPKVHRVIRAIVPYVDSQRLLLSRDITQGTRLETMRRDFVANVSHELRTPLTVLVGFLETVRELKSIRHARATA
jgi:two-component system phosphate regulon sensor histidine kinase PhoR